MISTKSEFLVTVAGIPGTWRTFSGGGSTASYNRDYTGGSKTARFLTGKPEFEDIALVRTYDPVVDQPWINKLRKVVGRHNTTVTKQPTDADFTKVGKPITFPGCRLIGLKEPDTDAASADASEVTLTFANNGPA
ncbi:hypothetical protein ACQCSX_04455 [Pseudarthrobacter sp. P1]|uniref:hypothetical protein n=1 Tax=Pseudarthrobacter sp. P1 TaxID=3418418 RepID=UPI003CEE0EDE